MGESNNGQGAPGTDVFTREMPLGVNAQANREQAEVLAAVKAAAASRAAVQATGISISGCADSQLSQESGGHGVFTSTLERVWGNNTFTGSYTAFHQQIQSQMGPTQIPQLGEFVVNTATLLGRTPFNL